MAVTETTRLEPRTIKNLDLDLYQIVWDLTSQVPEGRVTTYGALARALGDIRASRAIGLIEHLNPRPIIVPCHRVVYSNGGLGGFGAPEGVAKKIELLKSEGVNIKNGKIEDFDQVLFTNFSIDEPRPLEILRDQQKNLAKAIRLEDNIQKHKLMTIAGIDASYSGTHAYGAIVVLDINTLEILETQTVKSEIHFPYIPTYLSYYELPISLKLINKLSNLPDVILFDGNGVLHPLGMGIAAHAGIILRKPTMGIAKKLLCGNQKKIGNDNESDDINEVILNNQLVGYAFKPKSAQKRRVFISPGHLMSFETSLFLAKKMCKTRIPEPIRFAHSLASGLRKQNS